MRARLLFPAAVVPFVSGVRQACGHPGEQAFRGMVGAVPIVARGVDVVRLNVDEIRLRAPRRQAEPGIDLSEIAVIGDTDEAGKEHLYGQARRRRPKQDVSRLSVQLVVAFAGPDGQLPMVAAGAGCATGCVNEMPA